jgi:hypothetical protein
MIFDDPFRGASAAALSSRLELQSRPNHMRCPARAQGGDGECNTNSHRMTKNGPRVA